MRKRLTVLAVLVTGVLASAILAAGAQSRTVLDRPQAVTASGTVTLSGWSVGKTEEDLVNQLVSAFERKYPNINVKYDAIPNYDQAMLAKFSARQPPDVFYLNSEKAPTWISQGLIAPLDSYIKKTKFKTGPFYPRLLNAFKVRGKVYGFPKDWSPLGMEVNTELLAKAGGKAPTTWAQLRSVAQRLKSQMSGTARPICLAAEWQRALAFVYQNKGTVLRNGRPQFTSAAVRQAMNFYVQLQKDGLGDTPAKLGVGWCGEAIGKQKAAIAFEGNWAFPYLPDTFPSVKWRFYPMPKGKVKGTLAFTVSYSTSPASKNKDAAWVLISYLTGKTGMKLWTSKG
ncbi:MAG: extracellular solute-binding protein, partial [Actinobacteria bacterium]|nr:extracellular solute-binding protein [Actinomycetota bacterium]